MSYAFRLLELHRLRPAAFLLACGLGCLSMTLAGCDDNIACVFTTGCSDDDDGPGQGPLGSTATLPVDGQVIETGPPRVSAVFPAGDASSATPIVIVFSESLSAITLVGALEVSSPSGGNAQLRQELVAEGRVLLLFPQAPLAADDYVVRIADSAAVSDLTGQELTAGVDVGSFTVVDPDPSGPQLVTTFPLDGSANASQTGELIAVFDRALNQNTVTSTSFDVTVDGADPAFDPAPAVLMTASGAEARVFTYQSVDADDVPQRLGSDGEVQIALSAMIADLSGETLDAANPSFTTAPFAAPESAGLLSFPPDAIGLANLTPGADELTVQAELIDASEGDSLDLIFFGNDPAQTMQPVLQAFLRQIQLSGTAPITQGTFSLADIDITDGNAARVADGAVAFAFRLRRGGVVSPLRVLDADLLQPGIQDPLLDTVSPVIEELVGGVTDAFRSDQRGLVITGDANELISSVLVTSDIGDNLTSGELSPAVGSDLEGRFVAAPVGADLLPAGEIAYEVTVYDVANNPSAPVSGFFTQHGALGPTPVPFVPGDTIDVEVFDALTLEPLSAALVVTHQDVGDDMSFPFSAMATTDADGLASVASEAAVGTLLTVDLAGYDLFTFHGVTSARVSVGLYPVGTTASASEDGDVTYEGPLASLFSLNILDIKLGDARRPQDSLRTFDTQDCIDFLGLALTCPFLPQPIRPSRLGATTALAGDFLLNSGNFAAESLIEGFELVVPRPATAAGNADVIALEIPFLFQEPGVDPSEQPIELPATTLDASGITGFTSMLVGDPSTTGVPDVTVESVVPGIPGSLVVGLGLAFEDVPDELWSVRAAAPGSVTVGFYAMNGVVDPDLFLSAELRDMDGNRSARRPRQSRLADLGNTLELADVPVLLLPGSGASVGPGGFNLTFEDVLPDAFGVEGLYGLEVVDSTGRGWRLWRPDPDDGVSPVVVHMPDLSPAGGSALADGELSTTIEPWAWEGFDATSFLWSDLERERDVFAHSAAVFFDLLP